MSALQRLALRAMGAPSQVRPRLGGLFERDTGGEADDVGAASVSAQVSILHLRDQAVTPTARGEPPVSAPARPGTGQIAAQTSPQLEKRSGRLETSTFTAPVARSATDPGAPAASAQAAGQAGRDPQAGEAVRPVFAPLIERTIGEAARAEHDEAAAAPAAGPAPYRPLLPERRERTAPAAPLGSRSQAAAAGPADIQISIGRIEVRGEPEPRRPAPAPRRGPQLMSLEDYLSKGRRR